MTDVVLVRWPEETERLERLRAAGAPRLLLVGEDLAAPEPVDPLEDWIRLPAAEDDLRVRVSTLASRAGRTAGWCPAGASSARFVLCAGARSQGTSAAHGTSCSR